MAIVCDRGRASPGDCDDQGALIFSNLLEINITKEIDLVELKETHLSSPMCLPENTNVRINRLQCFICHLGLCALIDGLQELPEVFHSRSCDV